MSARKFAVKGTHCGSMDREETRADPNKAELTAPGPQADTEELIRLAEEETKQATDYYQFTSLINKGFSQEEKIQVVELMWQVAYADGHMDKYEDHLVRKLANLMHVSHKDFIAAKHRARAAGPGQQTD